MASGTHTLSGRVIVVFLLCLSIGMCVLARNTPTMQLTALNEEDDRKCGVVAW